MKNKTLVIVSIIILSVLATGLTVLMVFMLHGNFRFRNFTMFQTVSKHLAFEETYEEDFHEIHFNVGSGDILIKESTDDKIKVLVYGDEEDIQVESRDGQLKIDVKDKDCHFICFKRTISKVEVYLPSDYSHLIQIESNYGDTEIEKFFNAEIDIEQKYGDVSIDGGKTIDIQNDYGDIKINQVGDADIKCSAGDVVIGTVSNLKVQNNYGDVDVQKVENYLNIEEDCGEVNIREVNLGRDSSIKNSYGDIEIGFTNEIYIDASTSLGDVTVRKNYPKSNVTLTMKNSCGDIEVNN